MNSIPDPLLFYVGDRPKSVPAQDSDGIKCQWHWISTDGSERKE